jgi:hypothetical protein
VCMLDGKKLCVDFNFYPSSDPSETGDSVRLSTDTSCMKLCWVFRDLKTSWSTSGRNGLVLKVLFDPNEVVVSGN